MCEYSNNNIIVLIQIHWLSNGLRVRLITCVSFKMVLYFLVYIIPINYLLLTGIIQLIIVKPFMFAEYGKSAGLLLK